MAQALLIFVLAVSTVRCSWRRWRTQRGDISSACAPKPTRPTESGCTPLAGQAAAVLAARADANSLATAAALRCRHHAQGRAFRSGPDGS